VNFGKWRTSESWGGEIRGEEIRGNTFAVMKIYAPDMLTSLKLAG